MEHMITYKEYFVWKLTMNTYENCHLPFVIGGKGTDVDSPERCLLDFDLLLLGSK